MSGDDRFDKQDYFKAKKWRSRRPGYLKAAEPVHRAMERAGWQTPVPASPNKTKD